MGSLNVNYQIDEGAFPERFSCSKAAIGLLDSTN